jgi:hypothetical protein
MISPNPASRSTAQRLIEDAAIGSEDAAAIASAAERVFQRLHEHLSTLIGVVGWKTLLGRALKLARTRVPALQRIEVKPDGTIAGLVEALSTQAPEDAVLAPAMLLAQLLDLLAAFVGDDLALHLVDEATRSAREPAGAPGPKSEGSVAEGDRNHDE